MSSIQSDKYSLDQFPEMSSSHSDKYAAETLFCAEMRSILYEYVLLFTIYTYVMCVIAIAHTSYFKFVSYSLNVSTNSDKKNRKKNRKNDFKTRIRIDNQSTLSELVATALT